jgi:hypothetical protein
MESGLQELQAKSDDSGVWYVWILGVAFPNFSNLSQSLGAEEGSQFVFCLQRSSKSDRQVREGI